VGDDAGPGSAEAPFRTVQRAADKMRAGDRCEIHAGTYHETVRPAASGTSDAPLTFTPRSGDRVVISGTDPVPGPWTPAEVTDAPLAQRGATTFCDGVAAGYVLRAAVPHPLPAHPQVFIDGRLAPEAGWPDAPRLDPLSRARAVAGEGTTYEEIHDPDLDQPDGFWVGALVHVVGGLEWGGHTGVVLSSSPGQVRFQPSLPQSRSVELGAKPGNRYRLSGALGALAAAGDWHYDSSEQSLWVWGTEVGAAPDVEVKTRDWAFDLRGRSYVTVTALGIHAASIVTDVESRGNVLDRLDLRYVSHIPQFSMDCAFAEFERDTTGVILDGEDNVLRQSTVTYSAGNGVVVRGRRNAVVDNVISEINYAGVELTGGVLVLNELDRGLRGCAAQVAHNTIFNTGDCGILLFSWPCWPDPWPEAGRFPQQDNTISYNDVFNTLALTQDHGAIEGCNLLDLAGTSIDHNWVHDCYAKGDRHHVGACGGVGVYLDHGCANAELRHNVLWANGMDGLRINGSLEPFDNAPGHQVSDNTVGGGQRWSLGNYLAKGMAGTSVARNVFVGEVQTAADAEVVDNLCEEAPGFVDAFGGDLRLVGDEAAGAFAGDDVWRPGSSLPDARLRVVDDSPDADGFCYTGDWRHLSDDVGRPDPLFMGGVYGPGLSYPFGGTISEAEQPGATASLRFSGTGALLHLELGPDGGLAEISVDGGPSEVVDTFLEAPIGDQLAWARRDLSAGDHELTVVVTGRHNRHSNGTTVRVDRAVVLP